VLHQIFITLGNGVEWADTGNPKTGGYLVNPKYRYDEEADEYIREKDSDYGTETFELDLKYWKEESVEVSEIDIGMTNHINSERGRSNNRPFPKIGAHRLMLRSEAAALPWVWMDGAQYDPMAHTHMAKNFMSMYLDETENPYPNFSKGYSCFWEIEPSLIQKDWLAAGIEHLSHWQIYFNDPARYSKFNYKYGKWIEYMRSKDGYNYEKFDGSNYDGLAEFVNNRDLEGYRNFLIETIARLEPHL
jgi:hypothetical protein